MALGLHGPWCESGSDVHLSGLEKITALSFSCPKCKVKINLPCRLVVRFNCNYI